MQNRAILVLIFLIFLIFPVFARGAGTRGSGGTNSEGALPSSSVPVGSTVSSGTERINAYFFYEELCSLCHEDENKFISILQEKLPLAERDQYPNNFQSINIYSVSGRQVYMQVTDELGLDRGLLQTPFLVLGGRVFQGYDSISTNIREAYLTAAEDLYVYRRPYNPLTRKTGDNLFDDYPVNPDHVTMVYFYRITCPECAEVTPIIDSLPKTVSVNGSARALDIIRINTRSGNNGERVAAFFEAWQVPDKDRMVPIVFFSDSYLAGIEAISAGINQRLSEPPKPWKLLPEHR
jgi:thiol-disulfide isomerase/thioredoxin